MASATPGKPILSCDLQGSNGVYQSTDGIIDLAWKSGEARQYQLEESVPSTPETYSKRYQGPDLSSVRTGLAEGIHRFRVRGMEADGQFGPWSDPLEVHVVFMPAERVHLLLILGGIVVLMTVIAVTHGHLTTRKRREVEA